MNSVARDLVTVVIEDHRALDDVLAELEVRSGDPRNRRALVEHAIAELVRHAVAEEQSLYPITCARLPGGAAAVDEELANQVELERVMRKLERLGVDDPRYEPLLGELVRSVRDHVRHVELTVLGRLRSVCSPQELRELGENILRAKEIAPTRPHPHRPHRPPANLLLGPGIGMVDRIRDRLGGRRT